MDNLLTNLANPVHLVGWSFAWFMLGIVTANIARK